MATNKKKAMSSLTGGGTGALDSIDGNDLTAGDSTEVITSSAWSPYYLDGSGDTESSPTVIAPDTNPGSKRHKLIGVRALTFQGTSGAAINEFSTDGTLAGDSDTAVPTEKAVKAYADAMVAGGIASTPGYVERPVFSYKDADEIYIGAGRYSHVGTATQSVFWESTLTFQFGPGGSNADSTAIPASGVLYLYIDDSAVVSLADNELTAAEFVANTTVPTYRGAEGGFYNGNDRWTGLYLRTNSSSQIISFRHDGGDLVAYDAEVTDRARADLDTAKVAVTLTIPACSTKALVTFQTYSSSETSATYLYYRTTGSTGDGHTVGISKDNDVYMQFNAVPVFTNTSQSIDIWHSASGAAEAAVLTNGYFIPRGA